MPPPVQLWLRRFIVGCIFATTLVPLFIVPGLAFPFVSGRTFFFWIIVELATGAWVLLALYNAQYRPRFSWVLGASALFVGIMGVADSFGVDPARSIWSSLSRMEGFVTLAHLLAFLLVAGTVLTTERLWTRFFAAVAVVGVAVSGYALLQVAGVLTIRTDAGRIDATFGNALYYAGYLVQYLFLLLFLLARAVHRRTYRIWLGVPIVLGLALLLLTKTRSGIIGMAAGLLAGFCYLVFTKSPGLRRAGALALLFCAVAATGFFIASRFPAVQGPLWERFASLTPSNFRTAGEGRFYLWGAAVHEFANHPLLGIGQENFQYAANTYYDPALYNNETWIDRAHNVILEWLLAGGIMGAVAYALIYIAAVFAIVRLAEMPGERYAKAALVGFFAAYGTYLLFAFDTVATFALFASVLAYLHVRGPKKVLRWRWRALEEIPHWARPVAALLCVLATLAVIYMINIPAIGAAATFRHAAITAGNNPQEGLREFESIFSGHSIVVPEAYMDFSSLATAVVQQRDSPADPLASAYLNAAIEEGERLQTAHPQYAFYPYSLGQLFAAAGMYQAALAELEQARELSPRRQIFLFSIGLVELAQGAYGDAEQTFHAAYELNTSYPAARLLYAAALVYAGNPAQAEALKPDLDLRYDGNDVLLAAYLNTHDTPAAVQILTYRAKLHPDDPEITALLQRLRNGMQ